MLITCFIALVRASEIPPEEDHVGPLSAFAYLFDALANRNVTEENKENFKIFFEMADPHNHLGDILPGLNETLNGFVEIPKIMNFSLFSFRSELDPVLEVASDFRAMAKAFSKIWTTHDFENATEIFIEKSITEAIRSLGFDTSYFEKIVNTIVDIALDNITINQILNEYFGVNYENLYNILKKEIMDNNIFNLHILTNELLNESRLWLKAPYKFLSFVGEALESVLNPILEMISSENFTSNCKLAAESMTEEDVKRNDVMPILKNVFEELGTGKLKYPIFFDMYPEEYRNNDYSDDYDDDYKEHDASAYINIILQFLMYVGNKGGVREFIDAIPEENMMPLVKEVINAIDDKNFKTPVFSEFFKSPNKFIEMLYLAFHIAANPKTIQQWRYEPISKEETIESLINKSSEYVNATAFLSDIKFVVKKCCEVLRLSKEIFGRTLFNVISPIIDFIEYSTEELTKNGVTMDKFLSSIFTHGHQTLEYCNAVFSAKTYSSIKSSFFKLYDSAVSIWKASGVDIDLNDYSRILYDEFENKCNEKIENIPKAIFENLKGNIFGKLKGFPAFKEIMTKNDNFTMNFMMNLAMKMGEDVFKKSPVEKILNSLLKAIHPFVSKDGDVNALMSEIMGCDITSFLSGMVRMAYPFLNATMTGKTVEIDIKEIQKEAAVVQKYLGSIKNAEENHEKYINDANPIPTTVIIISVTVGVVVIAATIGIVVYVVKRRRRRVREISSANVSLII